MHSRSTYVSAIGVQFSFASGSFYLFQVISVIAAFGHIYLCIVKYGTMILKLPLSQLLPSPERVIF